MAAGFRLQDPHQYLDPIVIRHRCGSHWVAVHQFSGFQVSPGKSGKKHVGRKVICPHGRLASKIKWNLPFPGFMFGYGSAHRGGFKGL
jgi:hypothetical protein